MSLVNRRFYTSSLSPLLLKTANSFSVALFFDSHRYCCDQIHFDIFPRQRIREYLPFWRIALHDVSLPSLRLTSDMEEHLVQIDEAAFKFQKSKPPAPTQREIYIAGDVGDSVLSALQSKLPPKLPSISTSRITLAALRGLRRNVREGFAVSTSVNTRMTSNCCAIVNGHLYTGGSHGDRSRIQKWQLRPESPSEAVVPVQEWTKNEGNISGLIRMGQRMIIGSWDGKLLCTDLSFKGRTRFTGWANVRRASFRKGFS